MCTDVDFHIGLPMSEDWRVARHTPPGLLEIVSKLADWETIKLWWGIIMAGEDSMAHKASTTVKFIGGYGVST